MNQQKFIVCWGNCDIDADVLGVKYCEVSTVFGTLMILRRMAGLALHVDLPSGVDLVLQGHQHAQVAQRVSYLSSWSLPSQRQQDALYELS